jgi:hypothetical protein
MRRTTCAIGLVAMIGALAGAGLAIEPPAAPATRATVVEAATRLPGGRGLGTGPYASSAAERPFLGRVTEGKVNWWAGLVGPPPAGGRKGTRGIVQRRWVWAGGIDGE